MAACCAPVGAAAAEAAQVKVIASFHDRQSTKLIIESREPLVSGRPVYIGPERITASLGDLLSRSDPAYYYGAVIAGKKDIPSGTEVSLDGPAGELPPALLNDPKIKSFKLSERYTFDQKRRGEVTARQGDRAMIDRGTMHEVQERDLYRVYDSSSRYKGMLEIHGMGDFQSSGRLYNRLEDFNRRAAWTEPGDRVEFIGQRKLFALGVVGAVNSRSQKILNRTEESFGAGLLWNVTFQDGWGAEVFFGLFSRGGSDQTGYGTFPNHVIETNSVDAKFVLPIWFKKNFFYPSTVSPFLAAGFSFLRGTNSYETMGSIASSTDKRIFTVVPVLGGGVEFFPGRFFRPRLEVRYFNGPTLRAGPTSFRTESVFYGAGFATSW
ncbi:MAG: hypothetical protein Q8T11_18120 [Elusimicrobiota bacterium]|nr:hypothetical protein [Elusimicrobiota bacterium]